MPSREWRLRIEGILEAIDRIREYTEGMGFEQFVADFRTTDAVVRNLEVIGEATGHVPDDLRTAHADIPWGKMRDIRNVIAHEYFEVDLSVIWRTIHDDLPPLVPRLQRLL